MNPYQESTALSLDQLIEKKVQLCKIKASVVQGNTNYLL